MGSTLHPNGAVSSVIALGVARQVAESTLTTGTSTSDIPEGSNLYFTATRARSVLSALAPIYYNPTTGQISANIGISDVSNLQNNLNSKEPLILVKNTAFNKNFGSSADTVCQGNDSRLSDARTPLAHTHTISNVTGLQTALDNKANVFTGYTGSLTMITGVNFVSQTTTSVTLTFNNGVLTNVS